MKEYQSEKEFLDDYDPKSYDRPSITADILLLSVSSKPQANYRRLSSKSYSVLLVQRKNYPFKGKWCLPGNFLQLNETLEDTAKRVLKKEFHLENVYMEQLYTFSDVKRDPRMRVVSTVYMALVDRRKLENQCDENYSWFDITLSEEKDFYRVLLDNGDTKISYKVKKIEKEKTKYSSSYKIMENKHLAFDHALVLIYGMRRLRREVETTDILFHMIPEYFTLGELQQVYEVALGKKLQDPAFRRMVQDKVEKTDKIKTGEGHRPSILFRYKKKS